MKEREEAARRLHAHLKNHPSIQGVGVEDNAAILHVYLLNRQILKEVPSEWEGNQVVWHITGKVRT